MRANFKSYHKTRKLLSFGLAFLISIVFVINMKMDDNTAVSNPIPTGQEKTIYVATSGNDRNPGTLDQPFRTIQKGVDSASPGTTVYVRGGTYQEQVEINVSGSQDAGYITLQSYPGEQAIIDGQGMSLEPSTSLLTINNKQYIKVNNLVIQNATSQLPFGILVLDASHHIQITNNKISHIKTTERWGQGMSLGNDRADASMYDIVISGNTLTDIYTESEAIAILGNVEHVKVTNNVLDLKNPNVIGIDILGNYDNIDDPQVGFARDILVAENKVYNGGICLYVDGASRVTIERNYVSHCLFGIQVTSEKKEVAAVGNIVRNNIVTGCRNTCLAFGAWVPEYGEAVNCVFNNNTVFADGASAFDSGYVRAIAINRSRGCQVLNNIITGSNGALLQNNGSNDASLDYNVWYATGSAGFNWNGNWSNSFDGYRSISGQDANSIFADPRFSNTQSTPPDLSLQASSPAINLAHPVSEDMGEKDYIGNSRLSNGRIDIGAYEQK